MCPESLAHLVEGQEAKVGDNAMVKKFRRGQHNFTMYARTSAPDCPICLPDGSTVRFTNLPANIQERAESGPEVVAVLQNGAAYTSIFEFANGATARLDELIGCKFGVIPAIEEIDQEACEVMDEVGRSLEAETTDLEPALVGASSGGNRIGRAIAAACMLIIAIFVG